MMRRLLVSGAAAAIGWLAGDAAADLYRWVDPDTGSIKFSSYPPPWYGDPGRERGAPKVEHIPARQATPAPAPAPAAGQARTPAKVPAAPSAAPASAEVAALELRRKQMLEQLRAAAARAPERSGPELQKLFSAYGQLVAEMDRLDPQGAAARRVDTQALLERPPKEAPR
jgi:hypothetical protein